MQQSTDKNVLQSIKKNNMIFISAQPDTVYFHWQISLYVYQFCKHGLEDFIYVVVGYDKEPSKYMLKMKLKYPKMIHLYKDERTKKSYIPSIRPHILTKFFTEHPDLGKNVFYHDSDIFIVKLPRFDLMLDDDIAYLSDTRGYIGHDYLSSCSSRYKQRHKELPNNDILNKMCETIGIDVKIVKDNQNNTGGAQYLLKNIDAEYWRRCEDKCNKLHEFFDDYFKKYPITHHLQRWCVDMWVVLWEYWKMGRVTKIHSDLDFSWAINSIHDYFNKNIFHLAGVTKANGKDKFYKGNYNNKLVFDSYVKNQKVFNHVSPNNATFEYCKVIMEYVYVKENNIDFIKIDSLDYKLRTNQEIIKRIQSKRNKLKQQIKTNENKLLNKNNIRPPKNNIVNNIAKIQPPKLPDTNTPINKIINSTINKNNKYNKRQKNIKLYSQINIITTLPWKGIYNIDDKIICSKNIYRSNNNEFIIFWNGKMWSITYSSYENELKMGSGGLCSNMTSNLFSNRWNKPMKIKVLNY